MRQNSSRPQEGSGGAPRFGPAGGRIGKNPAGAPASDTLRVLAVGADDSCWEQANRRLGAAGLPVELLRAPSWETAYFPLAAGEADLILAFPRSPFAGREESGLRALRREFVHLPMVAWIAPGTETPRQAWLSMGLDECLDPAADGSATADVLRDALARASARRELGWGTRFSDLLLAEGSEPQYRGFFEHSPVGACIVDGSGKVAVSNPAFQRMLGYTADELRSLTIQQLTHPEDLERDTALFLEVLAAQRESYRIEKRFARRDGDHFPGRLTVYVERDEQGAPRRGFGIVEDVTEQRRAEEALRDSQAQLFQAQKMDAVGRLTGGVAHDFNNMLMVILGNARLLLQVENRAQDDREALREIESAAERSQRLTQQLLAFSRRQALQLEVLDLNSVLSEMDGMLRRLLGPAVEIVCDLQDGMGRVLADRGQMEQILLNLAVNARDAMPGGGRLTISTEDVAIDQLSAGLYPHLPAGTPAILLKVADTGCGMTPDTRERLFEPFFTTKGVGKGTGLGLSTVYGIVKQSRGYIWVDSEPGAGTTFRIYVPRVEAPAPPATPLHRGDTPVGSGRTVLLVEDEPMIRKLVRRMLEQGGYRVLDASGCDEAVAICRTFGGAIDLLITDMVMPHAGGREVARQVATLRPGTPVVYMSGYTSDEAVRHGHLEPGSAFLQKPVRSDDLLRTVQLLLGMESPARTAGEAGVGREA